VNRLDQNQNPDIWKKRMPNQRGAIGFSTFFVISKSTKIGTLIEKWYLDFLSKFFLRFENTIYRTYSKTLSSNIKGRILS